jgi:putative transposase
MTPEDLPCRRVRGASHIPPEWVDTSAVFFITINCQPRGTNHLTSGDITTGLFESITFLSDRHMGFPELVLLMPDHLHALISFSWEKKHGMNQVLSNWKRFTATKLGISWQRDYFDHRIRSEQDHQSTWFYIRENPVQAGLVETYDQWPHVWLPTGIGWSTGEEPTNGTHDGRDRPPGGQANGS